MLPAVVETIDTDYLQTMGIRLAEGRDFSESDDGASRPVALVNETLAQQRWPGGSALGRRVQLSGDAAWRVIIGVVKTANYTTLGEAPQPCAYIPRLQNYAGGMVLYVRSAGSPAAVLPAVEREIRAVDPNIQISDVRTGAKLLDQVLWGPRVEVSLLGVFGGLALALASVGLYGVMAYAVTRRRKEIGLRMALGAPRATVLRLVLREGMAMVAAGMVVGLGACLLAGRMLARALFGLSATDPLSLAAACATLMLVALAACWLPARAATRIDPMIALREL